MKRTLSILALLAVAACGGSVSSMAGVAADGGTVCLQPTVVGFAAPEGAGPASAAVDVDLGEVAVGLDPVELASVRVRPASGPESLDFVEGARLSVSGSAGSAGIFLAGGGFISAEGLLLSLPETALDLKTVSTGATLPVRLELAGRIPAGPLSLTLEVCVNKGNRHVTY
jgi:hypothetical protein